MAEEVNRVFVDQYAQWLFASEPSAVTHLRAEGIPAERIHELGNVMVDTMHRMRSKIERSSILTRLNVQRHAYGVVTLHRAELLADETCFREVWESLQTISVGLPLIAPLHPRTRAVVARLGLEKNSGIHLLDALGYVDMQRLISDACFVWTDSGGLQEETTALGVPCFTLREETERPITIEEGTNTLVGCSKAAIAQAYKEACQHPKRGRTPLLWDGKAAERIAKIIAEA
jgi:UDP-N-acetylglucosamine 2-epimerase (non-hydrolysing)